MHVEAARMSLELTDQGEGASQFEILVGRDSQDSLDGNGGIIRRRLFELEDVHWHCQAADLPEYVLQGLHDGSLEEGGQHFDAGGGRGGSRELSGRNEGRIYMRFCLLRDLFSGRSMAVGNPNIRGYTHKLTRRYTYLPRILDCPAMF